MRDPPQPLEVAKVAQGSVNPLGGLGKLQVLSRNDNPEAAQRCYDITVAFASDPQAVQILAVQDPNVSSLPRNGLSPSPQPCPSVGVGMFRSG